MEKYIFYLYVVSDYPSSEEAILNLKKICEEEIVSNYEIFIIDVLKEPFLAEESKILITPTLIKTSPGREIRLVGSLTDKTKFLNSLELEKVYG